MNYSNHNLRTDLQEWKNRLYRAPYAQFGNQLKYLLNNLDNNLQIKGLVQETINKHPYSDEDFDKQTERERRGLDMEFESEIHQTAYCYQFIKYIIAKSGNHNLHNLTIFSRRDFNDTKTKIVEDYISPIIYYLHDKLDKSNSTIYLLENIKGEQNGLLKRNCLKNIKRLTKATNRFLKMI